MIKKMKLTKKDKDVLRKSSYVFCNGFITFPKPISHRIEDLEKIIKLCKKRKCKKNEMLVGITFEIDFKKLMGKKNGTKIRKVKSIRRKG